MKRSAKFMVFGSIAVMAVIAAGFILWRGGSLDEPSVQVWVTLPDQTKLLQREDDADWTDRPAASDMVIQVDANKSYQQMDGFGAAMTDSSAWLIANKLDDAKRDDLMNKLFDFERGIGISYLRLPMGATDFSLSSYTYDDMPPGQKDPELKHFSIEHDKAYMIPMLQKAKQVNPALKIMGSPWSPPAWMKSTGSLLKGSLNEDAYEPYARYFVKFIQAYFAEGLPIDAVTPQNEPHYEPEGYPGMRMEAYEQGLFIKSYLGPAFSKANLDTKIVIWDHNWDEPDYPFKILGDPEVAPYIAGSAFHGYAGDVANQQMLHRAFPEKDIYFTESSGGEWAPDFAGNLKWDMQNLIIGSTRYWARTVLKWNLALDEKNGPKNGGCPNCRGFVKIDQKGGEVSFNSEYYAFGHASKFVKPGAFRIESNSFEGEGIQDVAFRNPDGSIVLIAFNPDESKRTFQVRHRERAFEYTLAAGAAATFVWEDKER
ncbi:glycoside hydrolase family 30 protein [Paenibacillus silvisoli]|uniref:glycoside hydrolase family 30 protein n=1 Tax=Paenibacillus silvisoli TaxID=3110539 RepID=UPI0028053D50|nr:glycoside hydrolase family 30 beta sandwich domain-containing protein [Paenibacillus silvisoli]